jgi:hypothetical protein
MNSAERAERIRSLAQVAISVLRRHDRGGYLDLPDGRVRALDCHTGRFRISFRRRIDVDGRPTTLRVKFEGEQVLAASWTDAGITRRSYAPGQWEDLLRRYDRTLAAAGIN